jgi:glucose/mannose-6-phosphate isomerase
MAPGRKATRAEKEETAVMLEELREEYGRTRTVIENEAKELALWLGTGWPVIYAPVYPLRPVAMRWRGQIGENSKRVASGHDLPEMNHNEIVGWEMQKEIYPASRVLLFEDTDQGDRLDLRIGTTAVLIEQAGGTVKRLRTRGEGLLARMFSLIALGDYTSVYLASGWKVDPSPVEKIDYLKSKLTEAER